MKNKKTQFLLEMIFSGIFLFGFTSHVFSASASFVTQDKVFGIGQTIHVDVVMNTENATINTVSGSILLPENVVKVASIETGKSIIPLWIDEPSVKNIVYKNGIGKISFSGIIPNGYSGKSGVLFSLLLGGNAVGTASLSFQDVYTLLNNGTGKKINASVSSVVLSVEREAVPTILSQISRDTTPPERLELYRAQNPSLFSGNFFIIFNALDTESGIDRYELFESKTSYTTSTLKEDTQIAWTLVKNPALLKDQSNQSYIYVKAIDREGNVSFASLPPSSELSPDFFEIVFNWRFISGILFIMALVFVTIFLKKRHARNVS